MTKLIGKTFNQTPINTDLGSMAYQDENIQVNSIQLNSVPLLELLIKSFGATYWFDVDDSMYTNRSGGLITSCASKGNEFAILTGTNASYDSYHGRIFWFSSGNVNAALYASSLRKAWGYRSSYFIVAATTAADLNSNGGYFVDANVSARVSVSTDSFGGVIANGELSHHAGTTAGYDDGNANIGGRLASSTSGTDLTIHAVAGYIGNYNGIHGDTIRFCTLNRGSLTEHLINNSTASSTNTATELYWGNRFSLDRALANRKFAELIVFTDTMLNNQQYAILEHYFKLKYAGNEFLSY